MSIQRVHQQFLIFFKEKNLVVSQTKIRLDKYKNQLNSVSEKNTKEIIKKQEK